MERRAEAVNSLLRNWCEADPADRWVYAILLAEVFIALYVIWSIV